jgi:hypothetical protein
MDGSEIAAVKLECKNLGLKHSIKTKTPVDNHVVGPDRTAELKRN